MDEHQLEAFSDRTAQKVIREFADLLGADIETSHGRKAVRDNWSWLTDTRVGTQFVRKTTWGATVVAIVGAVFSAIAWAISKGIAAIAAAGQAVVK